MFSEFEFYVASSFVFDGQVMLCVGARLNGVVTMYFTSDRIDYDRWVGSLLRHISADERQSLDHHALGLMANRPHCGTRTVTGWAAMAIIDGLEKYNARIGPEVAVNGWELPPNTLDTHKLIPRQVMARLRRANTEPMLARNVPQDVLYIFRGDSVYQVAIIYGSEQIADLAFRFPALSSRFLQTIPIVQMDSEVPRTSQTEMIVFGEDTWIDKAAATLTCVWTRVVRTMEQMGAARR